MKIDSQLHIRQAVILAGGLGTRLGQLTAMTPKPLVKVLGKPFLFWQLQYLQSQGITHILLLVAHFAEQIEAYFTSHPIAGLQIDFLHESEPMGTGGALVLAAKAQKLNSKFWLFNGDTYCEPQLTLLEKSYLQAAKPVQLTALMDLTQVDAQANLLIQGNQVLATDANPEGRSTVNFNAVDAGIYLFESEVILNSQLHGKFNLSAFWSKLIQSQSLSAYPLNEKFYDIGTPERLQIFESWLRLRGQF